VPDGWADTMCDRHGCHGPRGRESTAALDPCLEAAAALIVVMIGRRLPHLDGPWGMRTRVGRSDTTLMGAPRASKGVPWTCLVARSLTLDPSMGSPWPRPRLDRGAVSVAMASHHPWVKHQSLTGGVAVLRLRFQCGHGRGVRVQRARPAVLGLHALGEPECQASLDLCR
jgi:hypothetical protein